jgi:Iap family predicted aminopeptidase
MRPGRTPDELFELVCAYEALGLHRTGSKVDRATVNWLAEQLKICGFTVREDAVPFVGWESDVVLMVGGIETHCLAVPYEWEGLIDTTSVAVVDLDAGLGGDISVIAEPVRQARADGFDAVVFATRHPSGFLRAINRPLNAEATDFPVFLVGGGQLAALQSSVVHIRASAQTVAASTTNVVADNGGTGPRLMLTTPLTGWFRCAGERGTGVAVLLDLVTRLSDDVAITVVATGGHELGCFGAHSFVDTWMQNGALHDSGITSIMHIGASVAVETRGPQGRLLIATRRSMTSVNESESMTLREALSPIGLALASSPTTWIGEAQAWQHFGLPLVSITGAGNHFHTPEDRAFDVTSPAALGTVADAITNAARALINLQRRQIKSLG